MSKRKLGPQFECESQVCLCYGDTENYVCNAHTRFKGDYSLTVIFG